MISKFKLARIKRKFYKYKVKARYQKITLFLVLATATVIGFQNCSKTNFTAIEEQASKVTSSGVTCIHPVTGAIVPENQSFTAWNYLSISASSSEVCRSEERVCRGGEFTGSYIHPSCVKLTNPQDCSFNGVLVRHGQSVTAYNTQSVPFQGSCLSENRICNNGVLSGSYQYSSCSVGNPANCNVNDTRRNGVLEPIQILHGQGRIVYDRYSEPHGGTCTPRTLSCNNGQPTGTTSRELECVVQGAPPPANCIFNGRTILHNATVTVYESATVPFSQTCTPFTRTCVNGVMSTPPPYTVEQCTVQAATFNPVPVTGNTTTTEVPIKVFLIMDFSFSMVNELNKAKLALSAFLDEQRTRQAFDIYLYPISGHTLHLPNTPVTGTTTLKLNQPLAQMELRNNSNFAGAKADFMYRLQSQINLAATNTSEVNETGLCQIVRVLKEGNLYSVNDKVAFIVVTDENDGSSLQPNGYAGGCTEKIVSSGYTLINIFGNVQNSQSLRVEGQMSGTEPADGGGTQPFTSNFLSMASCGQYGHSCTGATVTACTQAMKDYARVYHSTNGRVVNQITSCQVTVTGTSSSFLSYINTNGLRTLSQQQITQSDLDRIMAQTQGFIYNGVSYTSLNQYAANSYPDRAPYTFNTQFQGMETYVQHAEFNNGPNSEYLNHQSIMNLLNTKIPNQLHVAMDFVIYMPELNPPGTTCGPSDVGSIGATYFDFVNQSGRTNLFKKESVCQSTYNSALLHAAGLAVWTPNRDYVLTGLNATNISGIRGVKIVNASGALIARLSAGQYTVNQTTKVLNIPAPLELPQGSQIILLPDPGL